MSVWNKLDGSVRQSLTDQIEEMTAFCAASRCTVHVLLDCGDIDVLPVEPSRLRQVPDEYFAQETSLAPHLLTLSGSEDGALLRGVLAVAVTQAPSRTSPQGIGAVLLAPTGADALLRHFVMLGLQHDPMGNSRVFRYQDPRVMQRVWSSLASDQRDFWLGPVCRWMAAAQPTGRIVDPSSIEASLWHASPNGTASSPFARPHRLLDSEQWQLAHSAPAEAAFWLLAHEAADAIHQFRPYPAIGMLRGWLNEAAAHRLGANDQCEWALCRWATDTHSWESLSGQQQVHAALELQRRNAGLGFGDAWRTAGTRA